MENTNKILKTISLTLGLASWVLLVSSAAGAMDGVGLWNSNASTFYLKYAHSAGNADRVVRYGPLGRDWWPLAGDWNNNGQDTVGLFDPVKSCFYLKNTHTGGRADRVVCFGPAGRDWWPLAGDWNNNGQDTVGLFDPVKSCFYLKNTHTGGRADRVVCFGPAGRDWWPLAGDWNNNGQDTVGLFDPVKSCFYLKNTHTGGRADRVVCFGPAGRDWWPLAGDWNNNGQDTVGLFDPVNNRFYFKNTHTGGRADDSFGFGPRNANWLPIVGKFSTAIILKPAYGQIIFEEMTSIAGVSRVGSSFGSAWGDFDGNGLPDLYSNNHAASPSLYLNTGSGTFTNAARAIFPKGSLNALGDTHGAAWADFDNDGDQDLIELVGAQFGRGSGPNHLYRNTGEKFKDEAELLGISYPRGRGRSPLWLDWDNDGRLDVFLANAGREIAPSALFRQTDNGFVDVSQDVGLRAHPAAPVNRADSVHLSDLTGDGRMDLLIVSHWNPRLIYLYDMSSVPFIEKASQLNLLPPPPGIRGAIVADFNNDLLPDVFLMTRQSNSRAAPNKLLLNTGSVFVDATGLAGLDAPTSCQRGVAADFDNDMDLDLYLICTTTSNNLPNLLYENVGDAVFVPVSEAGGQRAAQRGLEIMSL